MNPATQQRLKELLWWLANHGDIQCQCDDFEHLDGCRLEEMEQEIRILYNAIT